MMISNTLPGTVLGQQLEDSGEGLHPVLGDSLQLHGLFKSICRSRANPKKVLRIRGGAMQVYHHNQ